MDSPAQLLEIKPNLSAFAREVQKGLLKDRKKISSMYLYDRRGSELFCQIMELPEYYPTDAEKQIFENHSADFFREQLASKFQVIELGAGDGVKTEILLSHLLDQGFDFTYIPVDICEDSVNGLTQKLSAKLPELKVKGAVDDYSQFLNSPQIQTEGVQNVVLFLGSNIGNFNAKESLEFLQGIRKNLRPRDLMLIGFDLKKDIQTLTQAYNDSQGVTAEFNMNLLHRMNRELGAKIDVKTFTHYGYYNPFSGAMESCLISKLEQDVELSALGLTVHFDEFEPIHLEYSFKYTPSEIKDFAENAKFEVIRNFKDSKSLFIDSVWRARSDH